MFVSKLLWCGVEVIINKLFLSNVFVRNNNQKKLVAEIVKVMSMFSYFPNTTVFFYSGL